MDLRIYSQFMDDIYGSQSVDSPHLIAECKVIKLHSHCFHPEQRTHFFLLCINVWCMVYGIVKFHHRCAIIDLHVKKMILFCVIATYKFKLGTAQSCCIVLCVMGYFFSVGSSRLAEITFKHLRGENKYYLFFKRLSFNAELHMDHVSKVGLAQ